MRTSLLPFLLIGVICLFTETLAQAQTKSATRAKAAYQRTSSSRTKARAGAYARYDRSGRRDEENLKLAPGLRLNMPSPPTTDYMGRPLKKKPAKQPASGSSTISAEGGKKAAGRP
ncbi:hypothetical protein [Hymenobacter glacieicola]|uniref:Uncharacterized protein n=1 Tax=Hymenobacter glacieicola TaxID=1562124 RepID=A0ABQ1WR03_9BACT|nr:hypothetical protein [Hymenobacter glacieicola]GGG37504.1 hypothetical protein GCM10011378_12290 [Hymenobacter glacieicola]